MTSRWKKNESIWGISSSKNSLFPRSASTSDMKGTISLIRQLVSPNGPGADEVLKSLTVAMISCGVTFALSKPWSSLGHVLRIFMAY